MHPTTSHTNGRVTPGVGTDELTGVWNAAGFVAAAKPIFASCRRRGAALALAYFDFDGAATHEPAHNTAVDGALVAMADALRTAFRSCDVIGRVDTLRFAVLLPDCTDEALTAVEGMHAVTDHASYPPGLTLTAGMARSAPGQTLEELMRAADLRTKAVAPPGRGRVFAEKMRARHR